jgi:hypothetical protein
MDESPERREAYKNARIEISGLLFLVMEPPDPKYPFRTDRLRIDGCDMSKNLDRTPAVVARRILISKFLGKRMERFHPHRR